MYMAEKSAIAVTGVMFGGWGASRDRAAMAIRMAAMIKRVLFFSILYLVSYNISQKKSTQRSSSMYSPT